MKKLSILIPVYDQEELVITALDHLPRRNDIEVLVRDDGSTDRTLERLYAYAEANPDLPMKVSGNAQNMGVAYTKNRLLEMAQGEYFHIHDSDDHVETGVYDHLIDTALGSADVVCFDLIVNSGNVLSVNEKTMRLFCAQIARFIKTEFARGIKFPEAVRAGDDWFFAEDILKREPRTLYTGAAAYRYNFPRVGSLTDLRLRGQLP